MRLLGWFLMCLSTAGAQSSVSGFLEKGMVQAPAGIPQIPAEDKTEALTATANVLARHMTFRREGTSSAFYTATGRQPVEWKGFGVLTIMMPPVSAADSASGVAKRYVVTFVCAAHRTWDAKSNRWGAWLPTPDSIFPKRITLESKHGKWADVETGKLNLFTPGPGPSITDPIPDGKSIGLPPGMTREK